MTEPEKLALAFGPLGELVICGGTLIAPTVLAFLDSFVPPSPVDGGVCDGGGVYEGGVRDAGAGAGAVADAGAGAVADAGAGAVADAGAGAGAVIN